jgi:hypothetical protein
MFARLTRHERRQPMVIVSSSIIAADARATDRHGDANLFARHDPTTKNTVENGQQCCWSHRPPDGSSVYH